VERFSAGVDLSQRARIDGGEDGLGVLLEPIVLLEVGE
jgi:hypothetical protein